MIKKILEYTGLASLIAFEVPIHETIHATCAKVTMGGCEKIVLSQEYWYAKPLDWLTHGFYQAQATDANIGGYAVVSHADTFLGDVGSIITSAAPEFMYTTIGMCLVKKGLESYKSQPLTGMIKTAVGAMCMASTLAYMKTSFWGAQPGHDYYNVTQKILHVFHAPESLAGVLTPLVGIPLLFAAAYFTAAYITNRPTQSILPDYTTAQGK